MNSTTTLATALADGSAPPAPASPAAADTAAASSDCTYSISRRLSQNLALLTMAILATLFTCAWFSVKATILAKMTEDVRYRSMVIADIIELEAKNGGEAAVLARVKADASMRANSKLELWYADGRLCYADPAGGMRAMSSHVQSYDFTIALPTLPGGELRARYTADYARENDFGNRWALVFALTTLAAGALVALGTRWRTGTLLRPLNELAAQTRAISPERLDQRLHLPNPASELVPWIEQFNALMARLDRAYAQLEAFNADVAHELRTPLATLRMQTELALARERSADELRETMTCSLEELQRLSALVNDMLFLSQADRGARARRGEPCSLAALATEVSEFHEAALADAALQVAVDGDARVAIDEPLVKRALSNLLGNATRFARHGSAIRIVITRPRGDDGRADAVRIDVANEGQPIPPGDLPKLFTRFFRGDASRCCDGDEQHFGLGLAIVNAIARMHGGAAHARSDAALTTVGFTLMP